MRGAVAAGAVYGLGAVGPFVRQAIAQESGGDVDILNFALTLEYLEAAFYDQALKQVGGLTGDVKVARHRDPRQRERARRRPRDDDQGASAASPSRPRGRLRQRLREPEGFLEARPDVRGHRRERLQRRRAGDRVDGRPGRRRQHRADRGAPRGGDPPAATASRSPTAASTSRSRCRRCSTPSSRS